MFELTRRNNSLAGNYFDPFREMENLERAFFGRPFDSFFSRPALSEFRTDITDAGDHYLLESDLPGFSKENIRLELSGDVLTVSAQRSAKNDETSSDNRIVRQERSYGAYTRQFDVSGIDTDGIKGKYEDGVLKLTLPKKEVRPQPETRQLEIE